MATAIVMDTHKTIIRLKGRELTTKSDLHEVELRLTNTLTSRMITVVGIGVAILALIKFL